MGHFDLLTKFNEGDRLFDAGAPRYLDAAMGALDTLLKEDVLFEINTGAMSGERGLWSENPREEHPARMAPRTISSAVLPPSLKTVWV